MRKVCCSNCFPHGAQYDSYVFIKCRTVLTSPAWANILYWVSMFSDIDAEDMERLHAQWKQVSRRRGDSTFEHICARAMLKEVGQDGTEAEELKSDMSMDVVSIRRPVLDDKAVKPPKCVKSAFVQFGNECRARDSELAIPGRISKELRKSR